jgi:hypothetical protein
MSDITYTGTDHIFKNPYGLDVNLRPIEGQRMVLKAVKKNLGSFYLDTPATTTITTIDVWVKIEGTTFLNPNSIEFSNGNNRLTYNGDDPITFMFVYTASLSGSTNKSGQLGLSINGNVPTIDTRVINTVDSGGRVVSSSKSGLINLKKDDFVEIWLRNLTTTTDFIVENLSLTITS